MESDSTSENRMHRDLKRLPDSWYQGRSYVHWSMTMDGRETGWLDSLFHSQLRELLLHACCKYQLVIPTYILMPDHAHLLVLGTGQIGESDQKLAIAWLKRHWNGLLKKQNLEYALQRQSYDQVLRESDREEGAFEKVAFYILNNPVRAGIVDDWKGYPYLGAVVAGRPDLQPQTAEDYWAKFWRSYRESVA